MKSKSKKTGKISETDFSENVADYVKTLEKSIEVLQREVDELRHISRTTQSSRDTNNVSFRRNEYFNAVSEADLLEKLHEKLNEILVIKESSIFFFSERNKLIKVKDSNTSSILFSTIINFEEQGIIEWLVEKNDIDFIPDPNSSLSKKMINILIYPIRFKNNPLALFAATTVLKPETIEKSQLDSVKDIVEDGFLVLDNLRSKTELDLMNKKLDVLNNQMIRISHLSSIGELSAAFAIDIETPLQVAEGNITFIETGIGDAALRMSLVKEQISKIRKITDRMKDLTSNIHGNLEKKRTDLREVVNDVILISENIFIREGISIFKEFDDDTYVLGFKHQLEQVVLSLILNAKDAMPDGGTIRIGVYRDRNMNAVLSIQDNGIGIDGSDIEKIFEPYYTTKTTMNNLGMGLFYTKQIVEYHKGKISFVSELEKGSTIKLSFPLAK